MNMTPREARLAMITLVALLIGVTYWIGQPRLESWQRSRAEVDTLLMRKQMAMRLLDQGAELDERLGALRERLPRHPMGTDVTAHLLRNLQQIADQHGLMLLRREPEPERQIGDLYELAISCTWEGELPALVRFLYALQAQGAMVDVRQLTVTPVQGQAERLRGNVTVDYAYSRGTAE